MDLYECLDSHFIAGMDCNMSLDSVAMLNEHS